MSPALWLLPGPHSPGCGSCPVQLPAAERVRLDNTMVLTYTVDTCYPFPPVRRTEGASFVVTYVLSVRYMVYVKRLGETYMTLDRRLLLLYLLLLLRLKKNKTGQAGNSKNVFFSTRRKFSGEIPLVLKVLVVIYRHFGPNTIFN